MNERASNGYGGELASKSRVTFKGYATCQPDMGNSIYDYLIDVDGVFIRVQVKTSKPNERGKIEADIRRSHANDRSYKKNAFDIVSIVNADTGEVSFIDWLAVGCPQQISVWTNDPKNRNGFGRGKQPLIFNDFTDVNQAIDSVMKRKGDAV